MFFRRSREAVNFFEMILQNSAVYAKRLDADHIKHPSALYSTVSTYTELPRKLKKSERKPWVTSVIELKRKARVEKKDRQLSRERILQPPDNGLLVKELIPVTHQVYAARAEVFSSVSRVVKSIAVYCSITSEDSNLLVYEYLPNGSLWYRLLSCNKMKMGWELRYAIAVGAAKGLEYLHHGFEKPVIHRDVKSSNILLDEEWKPRIADFGLAKIVQAGGGGDWSHIIAGTHGYMPPENAYTCKVTEKSDMYSFGVVLMELVTGKRPIEPEFGENKDIVYWVCSKISSKESAIEIVDSNISENLKEDAIKVLRIAVHCTAKILVLRPTMRMVVKMLEKAEPHKLSDILVIKKDGENCAVENLKTSSMFHLTN